jgi:hypothetical protein
LAGARLAVQLPDNSIIFIDANGNKQPITKAASPIDVASIDPFANVVGSTLFLPFSGATPTAMRVDSGGAKDLPFLKGALSGLVAGADRLAWGTANFSVKPPTAELMTSALDGTQQKSALKESYSGIPSVLRPFRWSADGSKLYFSKEPTGLGGYILFSGRSNLWAYDVKTGKNSEVAKQRIKNAAICIDDLSPNEKTIIDHCTQKSMAFVNLANNAVTAVTPPPEVNPGLAGGARFSPDGSRIAYGLARHDPENEQGWVAVTDGLTGKSKLVATSLPKDYLTVVGWLDNNTIVLQSGTLTQGVWLANANGGSLKRLIDGTFLAIVPGR